MLAYILTVVTCITIFFATPYLDYHRVIPSYPIELQSAGLTQRGYLGYQDNSLAVYSEESTLRGTEWHLPKSGNGPIMVASFSGLRCLEAGYSGKVGIQDCRAGKEAQNWKIKSDGGRRALISLSGDKCLRLDQDASSEILEDGKASVILVECSVNDPLQIFLVDESYLAQEGEGNGPNLVQKWLGWTAQSDPIDDRGNGPSPDI